MADESGHGGEGDEDSDDEPDPIWQVWSEEVIEEVSAFVFHGAYFIICLGEESRECGLDFEEYGEREGVLVEESGRDVSCDESADVIDLQEIEMDGGDFGDVLSGEAVLSRERNALDGQD